MQELIVIILIVLICYLFYYRNSYLNFTNKKSSVEPTTHYSPEEFKDEISSHISASTDPFSSAINHLTPHT